MAEVPGTAASSAEIISDSALPIQSVPASEPRFSKRRTASRVSLGCSGCLLQAVESASRDAVRVADLKDTRLRGEQLLELRHLAHSGEFRIFVQLVFLFEAFFQRLAQILQR